ncbi:hypothetical protein [Sinomonas sp. P10A9]|uniref:Uncharacterized protein n=1 Tax=Sinomonas puerhi TaxID=3238584 RepID=A0AB39L0H3_9MICC
MPSPTHWDSHHKSGGAEVSLAVPSGGHLLHLALAKCVFNDLHGAAAPEDLETLVRGVVENAVIVTIVRASAAVRLASVMVRTTPPGT